MHGGGKCALNHVKVFASSIILAYKFGSKTWMGAKQMRPFSAEEQVSDVWSGQSCEWLMRGWLYDSPWITLGESIDLIKRHDEQYMSRGRLKMLRRFLVLMTAPGFVDELPMLAIGAENILPTCVVR